MIRLLSKNKVLTTPSLNAWQTITQLTTRAASTEAAAAADDGITLNVYERPRKVKSTHLAKEGMVAGVIYGGGSTLTKKHLERMAKDKDVLGTKYWKNRTLAPAPVTIKFNLYEFNRAINREEFFETPMHLKVHPMADPENPTMMVTVKPELVQYHPTTDAIQNVTFMRVTEQE
eukprot:GFYU01013573.1.p1 GENE.GFYU01013573.1~~GFYU01013573.1.p1  ORF type:complete len:174 (+),score=49.81 GFYU01013573.1:67-588(+)